MAEYTNRTPVTIHLQVDETYDVLTCIHESMYKPGTDCHKQNHLRWIYDRIDRQLQEQDK